MSIRYMHVEDVYAIDETQEFEALSVVALRILSRMPQGEIGLVCGPITTGGFHNARINLWNFNAAIETLLVLGLEIFNQMPFEDKIAEISARIGEGFHSRVLNEFYGPIFASGFVTCQYFMHNWRTSKGAQWEHEQARWRGVRIVYLDEKHMPIIC